MTVTFTFLLKNRKNIPLKYWRPLLMSAGIGALQSALGRLAKKAPLQDRKISVVHMNRDGSVDFPENCSNGVLLVPAPLSEIEWELQNAIDDQKGKSSLS